MGKLATSERSFRIPTDAKEFVAERRRWLRRIDAGDGPLLS
jgi:hypothetical protein